MHGRPVTKHADIQPVAHEYQRYKVTTPSTRTILSLFCWFETHRLPSLITTQELKNLIREKKNQVTGAK